MADQGGPVAGYARAIVAVAESEGVLERVEDELFRFARAMEANPPLRERLVDPAVPEEGKQAVVRDLLGKSAHPQTIHAIGYVISSGRARQLPEIADAVVHRAAEVRSVSVAEVRSAVPLTATQHQRLAAALAKLLGRPVEVKVVVDPSLVGGIVTHVGDTVIDGSIARRLGELRAKLVGA